MKINLKKFLTTDWINPIVIKELRQAVRSMFVSAAVMIFLFAIVVAIFLSLVNHILYGFKYDPTSLATGRSMFSGMFGVLSFLTIFFLPVYTGVRLGIERQQNNLDLVNITTLSPARFIHGKLLAGAVITLLMYSAAMPFLAATYLFRGIDMISVLMALIVTFAATLLVIEAAILVAVLPASKVFRALFAVALGWSLFGLVMGLNVMCYDMVSSGSGSYWGSSEFWTIAGIFALAWLSIMAVMDSLVIGMVSPAASNRWIWAKTAIFLVWLIWGMIAFLAAMSEKAEEIMIIWLSCGTILSVVGLLIASADRDQPSPRLLRQVPQRPIFRRWLFPFFSGQTQGMLWAIQIGIGSLVMTWFLGVIGSAYELPDWMNPFAVFGSHSRGYIHLKELKMPLRICGGILAYAVAYVMTGLLIWRQLIRPRFPSSMVPVLSMMLVTIGSVVPVLIAVGLGHFSWDENTLNRWYWYGNPVSLIFGSAYNSQMVTAVIWALLGTILNMPWFVRQAREFKPLEEPPATLGPVGK
jgi:hypothetical protein